MDWIKLSEHEPPMGKHIVYAASDNPYIPFIHMAWYNLNLQRWELIPEVIGDAITHWMPLPEPPKEELE